MRFSFSSVKSGLKKHQLLCVVIVTAVAALLAGAAGGIVFERNVGISLSDRLARRIGTANAQVVSCVKSGSALTVTVDFKNIQPEKEQKPSSKASAKELRESLTSSQHVWNTANYGMVLEGVREELISGPFTSGIDSVTIVCRHQGETMTTLTGDRVPQNAGVSVDKSGKRMEPAPFSSFEAHNPDGSAEGIFAIGSDSSQPAK